LTLVGCIADEIIRIPRYERGGGEVMPLHPCGFQVFDMEIEKIQFLLGPGAKRSASIRSGDNAHGNWRSIAFTAGIESI